MLSSGFLYLERGFLLFTDKIRVKDVKIFDGFNLAFKYYLSPRYEGPIRTYLKVFIVFDNYVRIM